MITPTTLQTATVLQSSGGGLSWQTIAIAVLAGILILGAIWFLFFRKSSD